MRAEAFFGERTAGTGDTRGVSGQRGWYDAEHAFQWHRLDGVRANVIKNHVLVVNGMLPCVAMFRWGAWCRVCELLLSVEH